MSTVAVSVVIVVVDVAVSLLLLFLSACVGCGVAGTGAVWQCGVAGTGAVWYSVAQFGGVGSQVSLFSPNTVFDILHEITVHYTEIRGEESRAMIFTLLCYIVCGIYQ